MVTIETFRKLALSFPEAVEQPHFHKTSFRVKKKIFATMDEKEKRVVLKFSLVDQSVFSPPSKTSESIDFAWHLRKIVDKILQDIEVKSKKSCRFIT